MDQSWQGIRSTKSSHTKTPLDIIDTMEVPEQAPYNDKTNMVFMTVAEANSSQHTMMYISTSKSEDTDQNYTAWTMKLRTMLKTSLLSRMQNINTLL
ncbi:hypothetical protein ACHAW6_000100 [Cyclotella cf. meneghiniana]